MRTYTVTFTDRDGDICEVQQPAETMLEAAARVHFAYGHLHDGDYNVLPPAGDAITIPRVLAAGAPTGFRRDRLRIVIDYAGADDWAHDPWGTAMMLFFDIAAVLDSADIAGDITPQYFAEWQYRRPASAVPALETLAADEEGDSYGATALAQGVIAGDVTTDDLIYAGRIMDRYTSLLRIAGKDY